MFGSDVAARQLDALRVDYGDFQVVTNERTVSLEAVEAGIESVKQHIVVDVRTWTTRDGSVLLVQHADTPATAWLEPGGTIDSGETPLQAASRETTEETGIEVDITELRGVCRHRSRAENDPSYGVEMLQAYFTAAATGGDLDRQTAEIADVDWFERLPDAYTAELDPPNTW